MYAGGMSWDEVGGMYARSLVWLDRRIPSHPTHAAPTPASAIAVGGMYACLCHGSTHPTHAARRCCRRPHPRFPPLRSPFRSPSLPFPALFVYPHPSLPNPHPSLPNAHCERWPCLLAAAPPKEGKKGGRKEGRKGGREEGRKESAGGAIAFAFDFAVPARARAYSPSPSPCAA